MRITFNVITDIIKLQSSSSEAKSVSNQRPVWDETLINSEVTTIHGMTEYVTSQSLLGKRITCFPDQNMHGFNKKKVYR